MRLVLHIAAYWLMLKLRDAPSVPGMSRSLLKLADRAPVVWTLGCGSLPFKNWFDGVPGAMSGQCGLEDRQLAMGLDRR